MGPRTTSGAEDARRIASGSLLQQVSQVTGLLAMLAIVTVLARELTLAQFGVYGLLASLAGYLLVIQNASGSAAVAGIAASQAPAARARAFSTAMALYAGAGAAAGILVAAVGVVLSLAVDMPGEVARQARIGSLGLGLVTALGWPLTVYRDALRADQLFPRVTAVEQLSVAAYCASVLVPALAGADLWLVIAASGALPLYVGLASAAAARTRDRPSRSAVDRSAAREFAQVAGYVSVAEAANAAIYALNRVILGIFKSSAAVAVYEGPVRAQSLVRSLSAAITVTTLPAATSYRTAGDEARLRALLLRGARYSAAFLVPLALTGMVLSAPVLDVWLGDGFREGGAAMAILLAYWVVTAPFGVAGSVLVATGNARDLARYAGAVALANVVLAVALAEPMGVEGVALATSLPYVVAFPWLVRRALAATGAGAAELVRRALLPAYALGALLAAALAGARLALDPQTLPVVAGLALGGLLAYWLAFYALLLDPSERTLVRDLAGSLGGARSRS